MDAEGANDLSWEDHDLPPRHSHQYEMCRRLLELLDHLIESTTIVDKLIHPNSDSLKSGKLAFKWNNWLS